MTKELIFIEHLDVYWDLALDFTHESAQGQHGQLYRSLTVHECLVSMVTSEEREGEGGQHWGREKELLQNYMKSWCETFENCKAWKNFKNLSFN